MVDNEAELVLFDLQFDSHKYSSQGPEARDLDHELKSESQRVNDSLNRAHSHLTRMMMII